MKSNRKFRMEDDEAVSAVIGVILMVAITVAIAATVYVYVSGMLGGGPQSGATVSMVQQGNSVLIQKVEAGPVLKTGIEISVIEQKTGSPVTGAATYQPFNATSDRVQGGDSIAIDVSGVSGVVVGDKFTVQLIYAGNSVGSCSYTYQG